MESPTIVLSAEATSPNLSSLAPLGVARFLVKPINTDLLLSEIEDALSTERGIARPEAQVIGELGATKESLSPPSGPGDKSSTEIEAKLYAAEEELKRARAEADEAKEALVGSTRALLGILESRQEFSGSHSARVAEHAINIAERLNLPKRSLHDLEIAALLHDVGKITLPEEIMAKASSELEGEDLESYKRHPKAGQAIIAFMASGDRVGGLVRVHHERFDGNGFPDRLLGDEIPIEGRVLAVANALDRALRKVGSKSEDFPGARSVLREMRGSALDPVITDHALELLDDQEEYLRVHESKTVKARELVPRSTLAQDIISADGILFLLQGTVLTDRYIERIMEIMRDPDIDDAIRVFVLRN